MTTTEWMLRDRARGAVIRSFPSREAAQAWCEAFGLEGFEPQPVHDLRCTPARFTRRLDRDCPVSVRTSESR